MKKAIAALRQRFAAPSADQLQQNPLCAICWTDYDGEDRPVELPCGHVFGEECIIAWARGTTPTARHNGCPSCRAQLLPPSMHSLTSALGYWSSDLWQYVDGLSGPGGVLLLVGLGVARAGSWYLPRSMGGAGLRFWLLILRLVFMNYRAVMIMGWRSAMMYSVVITVGVACEEWLVTYFYNSLRLFHLKPV